MSSVSINLPRKISKFDLLKSFRDADEVYSALNRPGQN